MADGDQREKQASEAQAANKKTVYTSTATRAQEKGSGSNDKERCDSCGMWKPKDGECKVCAKRPNRAQVKATDEKWQPALEDKRVANHDKERCADCGLWKSKEAECWHCAKLVTRVGSPQGKRPSPGLLLCSFGSGRVFDKAEEARERRVSEEAFGWYSKPSTKMTVQGEQRALLATEEAQKIKRHGKERCASCGSWKDKVAACKHCAKLLTRQQAAEAQAANKKLTYTSTSSRATDATGSG